MPRQEAEPGPALLVPEPERERRRPGRSLLALGKDIDMTCAQEITKSIPLIRALNGFYWLLQWMHVLLSSNRHFLP